MNRSNNQKIDKWGELLKRADLLVDGVGFPVDEKIKDLLVGLWSLNFETASSCGGHLDRVVFPYVLIGENPSKEELKELPHPIPIFEIFQKYPDLNKLKQNNLKIQLKLLNLLSEYYKNHTVLEDERLILTPQGIYGPHRLINQGVLVQEILSKAQKKEKIKKYQVEMQNFADFLKETYFA